MKIDKAPVLLTVMLVCAMLIAACSAQPTPIPLPTVIPTQTPIPTPTFAPFVPMDAAAQADALGRGMNFGNMLEAPSEGAWNVTLQESYFDAVKDAGFKTIRLPVRWSAYTSAEPPYTIDPAWFERVDWAVQNALARDLNIVVNVHHYSELMTDTERELPRFQAMWRQIAEHYKDYPANLVFELYNEPNGMSAKRWNEIAAETLEGVRESNPTRNVMLGGTDFNSVNGLLELQLPKDDPHLIATFHYYLPLEFTHQGADWVNGSNAWLGTTWGTGNDKSYIDYDMDRASRWAKENARPLWLGEFGAYRKADMDSRAKWTAYTAREAERHKINWAYWDFAADFAAYDRAENAWIQPLLKALMP